MFDARRATSRTCYFETTLRQPRPDHVSRVHSHVVSVAMRRVHKTLIAAVAVFAVAGCSSGLATTTSVSKLSADALTAGPDAYQQFCAECHGEDLRGTDEGPSFLSRVYEPNHHADAAFQIAVQRGSPQHHWNFGDMPPVEGISVEQIEAIVAYVRRVQSELGFID